ncbi:MAG: ABC transporter ATP-binding protein, partial [Lachnospiraceae bacterium]|nr:ABC transporter ATP-binding protein [Lachnospiraceae bacterium]
MKDLQKTFPNGTIAVNGVSLHIAKGEAIGLIGENGAGKTTLIKLIAGLHRPSGGFVRVFGEEPARRKSSRPCIGMVTGSMITDGYNYHFGHGSSLLYDDMTIELNLQLIGNIYRLPKKLYRERKAKFLEKLGLRELLHYRVSQLSLGQRMKAELAACLLFSPELFILDEPFIGVDVTAKQTIRDILRELISCGDTTLILTTHNVEELEKLCSRVVLLDRGQLVYNGSLDRMKRSHMGLHRLQLRCLGMPPDPGDYPIKRYVLENNALKLYY